MKKRLALFFALAALLLIAPFAGAADYNQELILRELEYLKQKVKFQEMEIQQLKGATGDALDKKIEEKVDTKIATGESAKVSLANELIDQLEIKGDLRVRYERMDRDNPADDYDAQNRWRTRFRVGGVWKNKTENWEIGAGLATGGIDGTSTNDTWGEESPFETGDIRLDYAYAKHKMESFSFILGQQKNPFETSWLYWDGDLRPTGFTAKYKSDVGVFATLGAYGVRFYKNDKDTAMLLGGQVGYENIIGEVELLAAVGYQHFDSEFSDEQAPNPDYDYQLGDLYVEATIPAGAVKLTPYGHIWCNFGADGEDGEGQLGGTLNPGDEDLGWLIGLDAKIMKLFKVGYAYAVVGADSLYGGLKDSDFGAGLSSTDLKGHKISASYSMTKNISTGVTAFFYEADARENQKDVDLYQCDVVYKF
ncbi:MAG: putative porin [Desulfobacterales bacterium]|jgi:hypothetical protein|nr:putative porin [Desulfobacterales bacterium]